MCVCVYVCVCVCVLAAQSRPTLCHSKDCSSPGSSVRGILQARMLEWVPSPPPGDLPDPGVKPESPALADGFFTTSASWEASLGGERGKKGS